jgi:hypothetical protein
MALSPGSRLGPYEITAPINAGGMGEVYRAMDTNLKRIVADRSFLMLTLLPAAARRSKSYSTGAERSAGRQRPFRSTDVSV